MAYTNTTNGSITDTNTGNTLVTSDWSTGPGKASEGATSTGWSHRMVNAETGHSTEVSMHQCAGEHEHASEHTVIVVHRDENGKTIWSSSILTNADGTKTETTSNPDGSFTTKTYDKDGNVIDLPIEDKDEFWDIDIIYGEPPMVEIIEAAIEVGEVLAAEEFDMGAAQEILVDAFDFM